MTNSCNTKKTCVVCPSESVKLPKWTCDPQPVGCLEHDGLYYINKVKGSTIRPDLGLGEKTYEGAFDLCGLIRHLSKLAAEEAISRHEQAANHCETCPEDKPCCDSCEQGSTCESECADPKKCPEACTDAFNDLIETLLEQYQYLIDFFAVIKPWDKDRLYGCEEFSFFEGKLIQSRIAENDQHPHNRKAWKEHGTLFDILNHVFSDGEGYTLTIPYYRDECSQPNCRQVIKKGSCYAVKVKKLGKDGKPEIDECGDIVLETKIFVSRIDCNPDHPLAGSIKNEPTWDGGYNLCEYMNRPIGYDLNGLPIYSIDRPILITDATILAPLAIITKNGKRYLGLQN